MDTFKDFDWLGDQETGNLGQSFPLGKLPVWDVVDLDANEERLIVHRASHQREVEPGASMLNAFVKLADAKPVQIRDFARKWGFLQLCKHGGPGYHELPPDMSCVPLIYSERYEPVDAWRFWAHKAAGILRLAAQLHSDVPVDKIQQWPGGPMDDPRKVLGEQLTTWLRFAKVRVKAEWRERPRITLEGPTGLFGVLGVRLMSAAFQTSGLAVCSSCGNAYAPTRRPRRDRNNYCPDCGLRAAYRDSKRRQRSSQPPQ